MSLLPEHQHLLRYKPRSLDSEDPNLVRMKEICSRMEGKNESDIFDTIIYYAEDICEFIDSEGIDLAFIGYHHGMNPIMLISVIENGVRELSKYNDSEKRDILTLIKSKFDITKYWSVDFPNQHLITM